MGIFKGEPSRQLTESDAGVNPLSWWTTFSYTYGIDSRQKKTFVGPTGPGQRCVFCGPKRDGLTFKKVAHVIPACLGNRTLFTNEECDDCNLAFGSSMETSLANYFLCDRILCRKRSRSGSVKHRTPRELSRLESSVNTDDILLQQPIDGFDPALEWKSIDPEHTEVKLTLPPFRPIHIAQALARMAYLVSSSGVRSRMHHLVDWIAGRQGFFPIQLATFLLPGTGFRPTGLFVACGDVETADHPIAVILLFGFQIVTMLLPLPTGKQPHVDAWPTIPGIDTRPAFKMVIDIRGDERIDTATRTFTLTHQPMVRLDGEESRKAVEDLRKRLRGEE